MAITNIAFITFLALKNTPLAFLTSYSHERLNQLHQIGGYTTVTYIFIHLTLMVREFTVINLSKVLTEKAEINGMVAASAAFIILIGAIIIRRIRYELFYVTHVAMYVVMIVNIAYHRPEFATKTIIVSRLEQVFGPPFMGHHF